MSPAYQTNFIEDPNHRTLADRPIMCPTTGLHFYSVFIEVSLATYITKKFQDWLDQCIFTRVSMEPGASVRIAIIRSKELN